MNNYLLSLIPFLDVDSLRTDTIQLIRTSSDILENESLGLTFIEKFLIFCFFTFSIFLLFRFFMQKTKQHGSYISDEEMKAWKQERKKKNNVTRVDFKAVSDNLTKSNSLWKKLSKETHEAKWLHDSVEKIKLAAELNSLVNKNKNNYNELQNLEIIF